MIFMFFSISHPRGTWWWWVVLLAGAAHRVSGKEGPHHGGLHFDEHLLCFFHRGPHFPGNSFVYSVSSLDMHDYRSHSSSFRQAASPVIPYISMACVFAFILSFGLGPGKEPEYSFFFESLKPAVAAGSSCASSLHAGGVTNILTTELFTQTARPAAYVIAGSVNWLSFFFIGLVFPFIVVGVWRNRGRKCLCPRFVHVSSLCSSCWI